MKKIFFLLFVTVKYLLLPVNMYSQSVAINNDGSLPNPRSILDLKTTDKGVLLPRMASAQRLAIPTEPGDAGLIVFDTDKQTVFLFDGQNWMPLAFITNNQLPPIIRTASDPELNSGFGYSVAINDDYAIVGSYMDDIGSNANQGSAYIFFRENNAWTEQAKLTASDGLTDDLFGKGVSISGNYAVVGAPGDDIGLSDDRGSAYIFVRNGSTWTQHSKITAGDGTAGDYFGNSVSIDDDYIVIGAYLNDVITFDRGSAYVYFYNGAQWTQQATLIASDGVSQDQFGYSVDIDDDYVIIGAHLDDIGASIDQGSAYIFFRTGTVWAQQSKLIANGGTAGDAFGKSVAISGDYAIIGRPYFTYNLNSDQGSVQIFFRNGTNWVVHAAFHSGDGEAGDLFGSSVGISGDYALIGAAGDGDLHGSVYLYKRSGNNWFFVRKIFDLDSGPNNFFGQNLSLDGSRYLIGAHGKPGGGSVSFGTID